jgi:uncharacterized membrane protein
MTDATPRSSDISGAGRGAAIVVWALYLLSIPSAALFALIGVIVAFASRESASPWARSHLDEQIRIWWIAVAWNVAIAMAALISWMLTIILIGFPLLWLCGIGWFVVMIWFTVKSLLGLIRLLDGRSY